MGTNPRASGWALAGFPKSFSFQHIGVEFNGTRQRIAHDRAVINNKRFAVQRHGQADDHLVVRAVTQAHKADLVILLLQLPRQFIKFFGATAIFKIIDSAPLNLGITGLFILFADGRYATFANGIRRPEV